MQPEVIQTDKAPAAIGPYSQGIASGALIFVSGQLGMLPETGELMGDTVDTQARQALENLSQVLGAAGAGLEQVAAVDVFLTDMDDFAVFNEIYESFFSDHKPARAVVAVRALPKGGCVEIKCVAVRTNGQGADYTDATVM
ncbi:MAG: RidA family protein [Desulfobacterales bacterium]|nr:RidA family protein [Desulfobacterales bacterium]